MRAVVDTNVWVSGIAFPAGTPGQVLRAVRDGAIEAVASWELATEIAEVLRRPRIRALGIADQDIEEVLVLLAPLLPRVDIAAPIRDPDDAPVIASAIAGNAEAIISGDQDLLGDPELARWLAGHGVEVLSPVAALARVSAG